MGGIWESIHASKDPTTFTVLFEDSAAILGLLAALIGVFLSDRLGDPSYDGIASIVIGLILAGVALLLIYESKGLLVGEGVNPNELRKLRAFLQSEAGGEEVRRIVTMHFGPQTVLLATELRFRPDQSVQEIASIVATLKKKIREGRPEIKHIFIAIDSDKK